MLNAPFLKKCININKDTNLTLLQIQSTPIGAELPRSIAVLLSRPMQGILPQMNRVPMNIDNYDVQYEAL